MSKQDIPSGLAGRRKSGATYYTPERIAAGRRNIEMYGWAQGQHKRLFADDGSARSARTLAALSDETLWALQPSTSLPRMHVPSECFNMCPVHGEAIRAHDAYYAWRLDPLNHPYKLQCPVGKEWYPSNDYAGGDMTSGEFPDDGNGILRDGKRYFILREYAHRVYRDTVVPALDTLSQAYLLSGDPRYAHKCAVLLTRLASEYPNYGWDQAEPELEDRSDRTLFGPWNQRDPEHPWAGGGLISYTMWECSYLITIGRAYDALFDAIGADPELLAFARGKGLRVATADELRKYIETYLLRAGAKALLTGRIGANEGGSQRTAAELALLYDNFTGSRPNSIDLLDFAFFGRAGACNLVGCGIYPITPPSSGSLTWPGAWMNSGACTLAACQRSVTRTSSRIRARAPCSITTWTSPCATAIYPFSATPGPARTGATSLPSYWAPAQTCSMRPNAMMMHALPPPAWTAGAA